jgi:hypothetical protein
MRRRQSEAEGSDMCEVGGSGLPVSEQCKFVTGQSIHQMLRMGMITAWRMMEWIQQKENRCRQVCDSGVQSKRGDRGVCQLNKESADRCCVLTTEDVEGKGERNDVKGHFCQDVKT